MSASGVGQAAEIIFHARSLAIRAVGAELARNQVVEAGRWRVAGPRKSFMNCSNRRCRVSTFRMGKAFGSPFGLVRHGGGLVWHGGDSAGCRGFGRSVGRRCRRPSRAPHLARHRPRGERPGCRRGGRAAPRRARHRPARPSSIREPAISTLRRETAARAARSLAGAGAGVRDRDPDRAGGAPVRGWPRALHERPAAAATMPSSCLALDADSACKTRIRQRRIVVLSTTSRSANTRREPGRPDIMSPDTAASFTGWRLPEITVPVVAEKPRSPVLQRRRRNPVPVSPRRCNEDPPQ